VTDLKGQVAWVTGAGTGIGEATALALAKEGVAVALSGRRREPLQSVADRIGKAGGKALVVPGRRRRSGRAGEGRGAGRRRARKNSTFS